MSFMVWRMFSPAWLAEGSVERGMLGVWPWAVDKNDRARQWLLVRRRDWSNTGCLVS